MYSMPAIHPKQLVAFGVAHKSSVSLSQINVISEHPGSDYISLLYIFAVANELSIISRRQGWTGETMTATDNFVNVHMGM